MNEQYAYMTTGMRSHINHPSACPSNLTDWVCSCSDASGRICTASLDRKLMLIPQSHARQPKASLSHPSRMPSRKSMCFDCPTCVLLVLLVLCLSYLSYLCFACPSCALLVLLVLLVLCLSYLCFACPSCALLVLLVLCLSYLCFACPTCPSCALLVLLVLCPVLCTS
jgi:hypothetical protein